jgi:undecaprenyl-phosphate galactose phosphotransferase
LRRAGLLKRRVLILGAGKTGALVAKALKKEPNLGYDVIGFLDDDEQKVGTVVEGVKVHRGVDSALTYLRRCNVSDLVLAMPGAGRERLQALIKEYQHQVPNMLFVPDLMGMSVLGTSFKHFFDEQAFALEVKNELARPLNRAVKRAFDLAVGSALLLLLALPVAALGIIIRLTSAGPALYRQERVGKGGRSFECLKFRTMYADADLRLADILSQDPAARAEWESCFKLRNDPRVTPVGAFLRKTSLDELPQLLNVIAGEMSLVGPRPVTRSEIDDYYRDEARLYLSVLPGITGLWQVSGRSNTDYDYRIALDSWYVRNWNLWLDVVILMKTVGVVLRREGAY